MVIETFVLNLSESHFPISKARDYLGTSVCPFQLLASLRRVYLHFYGNI